MSWHSREELLHQVVLLHAQGTAQRAIARALGVSRNTVKVLVRLHRAQRESAHSALAQQPSRAPRARKIDTHRLRVAALLEKFPDITAQRVYEILRAHSTHRDHRDRRIVIIPIRHGDHPIGAKRRGSVGSVVGSLLLSA